MERNSLVLFLCCLIAFCAACTPENELSSELKAYRAQIVLEGIIQRTQNNSVTVQVSKWHKSELELQEIIISGFSTDQPCIISTTDLLIGEKYVLFIREVEGDSSYVVDSNPILSTKNDLRAIRRILCDGCAKPPKISKQLKDRTIEEGGRVTLKCKASGLPVPTVSWTFNGEPLTKGVKNSKKGSRLKIKNAKKSKHEGEYTCIASNGVEEVTSSARIEICALSCVNGELNVKKCSCSCEKGWSGDLCDVQEIACQKNCEHGRLDKSSCQCQCREGYIGEFCNVTDIPATTIPACTKVCGNHGDLDVLACQCDCEAGYSGEFCESQDSQHGIPCTEENYCLNGGICYHLPDIGERTCQCKPNYSGPRCQNPKLVVDKPGPNCDYCLNGGTCIYYEEIGETVCNCKSPFTGTRCNLKDPFTLAKEMQRAEDLQTKRILTIVGIFVTLLVLITICIVAWCKARKEKKTWKKTHQKRYAPEEKKEKRKKKKATTEAEEKKLRPERRNRGNGTVPQENVNDLQLQHLGHPTFQEDPPDYEQETIFYAPKNNLSSTFHSPNQNGFHGNGSPQHSVGSHNSAYNSNRSNNSHNSNNSPLNSFHSNKSPYNSRHSSPNKQNSPQHSVPNGSADLPIPQSSLLDNFQMLFADPRFGKRYNPDEYEAIPGDEETFTPQSSNRGGIHETDSDLEDDLPRYPVAETEEEDSNMDDAYIYLPRQPHEPLPEHAFIRPTLDSFEVQSGAEAEDGSVYTNEDVTTNASESDTDSSSDSASSSGSDLDIPNSRFQFPGDKGNEEYTWEDEFPPVTNSHTGPALYMANPYAISDKSPVHRRTAPNTKHAVANPRLMNPPPQTANPRLMNPPPQTTRPQASKSHHENNGNEHSQSDEEYLAKLRDILENQKPLEI